LKFRQNNAFSCIILLFFTLASCTNNPELKYTIENDSDIVENKLYQQFLKDEIETDSALILYHNPETKKEVINFFSEVTKSKAIAEIILLYAQKNNIPPTMAFALAEEESEFNLKAIHKNSDSIDRGLFQLNSKSFPKLKEKDFFDARISTYYGLAHLSHCLKTTGNEVAALAMYNAGYGKITSAGTPRRTLDYISRILKSKMELDIKFSSSVASRYLSKLLNKPV